MMAKPVPLRTKQRERLEQFIATEGESLQPTLRMYVLRAGLATIIDVDSVTHDLGQDAVVEALR